MTDTSNKRIVITGMGIISPIGHDIETVWQAMLSGKSGAAPTTIFDASTMPTQFSAEVKDFDLGQFIQHTDKHAQGNRGSQFVVAATAQACRQAGLDMETDSPSDTVNRLRLGVYLGAGEGSVDSQVFFEAVAQAWHTETRSMDWAAWADVAFGQMKPWHELEQEPNMPAAHVAMLTGARGPTRSCLTACAASTQAVGEAMSILRSGDADVMIAGGAHSMIHPLGIMGFNRLTALSTRNDSPTTASRPFSNSRDGFVIGEGAATLVLETLASAQKRGVPVLAELVGYGSSADAFRVTDMHDEARGAIAALNAALADANVPREDIDYINAHGTSTSENDSIETLAIKGVFGPDAGGTPISSVKSTMGHLIGAAGAAELIACVMALRDNTLPPTMNLNDSDPALDLDYVPNAPRKAQLDTVINESFGFGGQNNVVVLKRFQA
ncbi:MAG: beta-ketoacyl-[acyl-carrier-protein] synthase family protein [Planctomycetes bacterium]|nr:beta-ketoacyl-[acyl-carrier-protein] synthase family protein [Planctomycetota bacterium]